jgi:hypothetical protein
MNHPIDSGSGTRSGKDGIVLGHEHSDGDARHIDGTRVGVRPTGVLDAKDGHDLVPVLREDLGFETALRAKKA